MPAAVLAGLVTAVILDTLIQITWKLGVATVPPEDGVAAAAGAVLANPWFYVAMAAFGLQLLNWLRVLARADLSFAQPFTALSYVTVLALSNDLLHEHLSAPRLAGVALIFLGVWGVSRTPYRSVSTAPRAAAGAPPP